MSQPADCGKASLMPTPYFCGIPYYDLKPEEPLADLYAPCQCGREWEEHKIGVCPEMRGFGPTNERYRPNLRSAKPR